IPKSVQAAWRAFGSVLFACPSSTRRVFQKYRPPPGCRGCGVCTAVCPRRAISLKHSKDEQINAKIDALLESHDLAA
ncbi:MAG: hypothetical protein R6X07_14680, partial [Desulfatiglandales bacterium]